ncbi:DUF2510 domain-containing protein [Microbacterium sp. cf332]|uniref:DUF2510 domain-containing protein n=1 Tax=Microbacterium sp. cf332 TaxID=1761804 RepID=UPI00088EE493|nr:DUF2510 domain-containing protein [Microbacterium sp. cf332]SDQ25788.1 Protein of unknown function [Microbacterium sp. cf332]
MNDVPESVPTAPAGWHPDPSGQHQLRYWDGQQWTDHVSPYPEAGHEANGEGGTAPATARPQASQPSAMPHAAPVPCEPGQKVMTRGTWIVLAATVLVVGGAAGFVGWNVISANAAVTSEAPDVVEDFLAAATADDPSWTEYASPGYIAVSGPATPLYGDARAAASLDLAITYETRDILYGVQGTAGEESPGGADAAKALVDMTYTFTVDGTPQTTTATRELWLTRPYYYGDDVPSAVRPGETPTAIGPWRVTGAAPTATYEEDAVATTSFEPPRLDQACYDSEAVLSQLSDIARTRGVLAAVCLSGGDSTSFGDDIDIDALAADFPVVPRQSMATDLMGWQNDPNAPAPLEQYRLTSGDTEYVFVLAATGVGGELSNDSERRIILIEKAETR